MAATSKKLWLALAEQQQCPARARLVVGRRLSWFTKLISAALIAVAGAIYAQTPEEVGPIFPTSDPEVKYFSANQHEFSFPNAGWGNVCYSIVSASKLRYDPDGKFCLDVFGLCGGMALYAGERYVDGTTSFGLTQGEARAAIADAQNQTLDEAIVWKILSWIASPDYGHWYDANHSIGYRMKEDWQRSIKPRLDSREPVVLGLVFDKRARLIDLREAGAIADINKQHQVLGIGYVLSLSGVQLRAYDPNYPGDILELTFTPGRPFVDQRLLSGADLGSDRRTPRGIMFVRGVPETRRWHVSYARDDRMSAWHDVADSSLGVHDMLLGDFNGDGKTDVLAAWGGKWYVSYFDGQHMSEWQHVADSSLGVHDMLVGDFNGDGKTDVLAAWGGKWYVTYSGTGGWSNWQAIADSGLGLNDILLGDFNGDGKTDVFAAWGGKWRVSYSDGQRMSEWKVVADSTFGVHDVVLGDFNGDGKTDVLAAWGGKWRVTYSGTGRWSEWQDVADSGLGVHDVLLGDFNGDKKADVFAAWGTR